MDKRYKEQLDAYLKAEAEGRKIPEAPRYDPSRMNMERMPFGCWFIVLFGLLGLGYLIWRWLQS